MIYPVRDTSTSAKKTTLAHNATNANLFSSMFTTDSEIIYKLLLWQQINFSYASF